MRDERVIENQIPGVQSHNHQKNYKNKKHKKYIKTKTQKNCKNKKMKEPGRSKTMRRRDMTHTVIDLVLSSSMSSPGLIMVLRQQSIPIR